MIAETSIIGMFLYSHYLYTVVSVVDDTWQNKFFKFGVRTHLFGILPHANMAFVDQQGRSVGLKLLFRPLVGVFGLPHLCREDARLFVLNHAAHPCGYAFSASTVPIHMHFIEVAMSYGLLRKAQFPVARSLNARGTVAFSFLPTVEIAHKIYLGGIGRPFSEHPAFRQFMQTIILVTIGKVG